MKNKLLFAIGFLFSGMVNAQDLRIEEVPPTVLNSFKKSFPNATKVEWEKKGNLYDADFEIDRKDHEVLLNAKGQVVRHKQEIASQNLPAAVRNSISKNYKGYRIDDAEQIKKGNEVFYKVELKKLSEELKLHFDKSGNLVSKNL